MTTKIVSASYLVSKHFDLVVALIGFSATYTVLPALCPIDFAKQIYLAMLTVASIFFSITFAAFAVIGSSADAEFTRWLDERNFLKPILDSTGITLMALFFLLCLVATEYGVVTYRQSAGYTSHRSIFVSISTALFAYAICATYFTARDALNFTMYKAKFEPEDYQPRNPAKSATLG